MQWMLDAGNVRKVNFLTAGGAEEGLGPSLTWLTMFD